MIPINCDPNTKWSYFNGLVVDGGLVMVHLDARTPGVQVPSAHRIGWLRLTFNHERGKRDLVLDDWGIRETLRFRGVWCPVSVPWDAVFMLSAPLESLVPVVFAEHIPPDFDRLAIDATEDVPAPRGAHLRLVK